MNYNSGFLFLLGYKRGKNQLFVVNLKLKELDIFFTWMKNPEL